MAPISVGTEALLVKRVWRVTTSSLASKMALMSSATLISCKSEYSCHMPDRFTNDGCHKDRVEPSIMQ